ncbi:unnamed protein product, partial [marine sediment metagenome]
MEIKEFNPTRAEVQKAKDESLVLLEKEITDVNTFTEVDEGRKKLAKMMSTISNFAKAARAGYIKAQKDNIKQENELIDEIKPTRDKLKEKLNTYKEKQIIETRKKFLPKRMEQFAEIKCDITEEELLKLDDDQVAALYVAKKEEYLDHVQEQSRLKKEAEEKELADEREALRKEKEDLEREKERVKKDAENAARQAELDKEKAVQDVKDKAESDRQKFLKEQKEKDD